MTDRAARTVSWVAFLSTTALYVATMAFSILTRDVAPPSTWGPGGLAFGLLFLTIAYTFAPVGQLILARHPHHRIGWLLVAIAFSWLVEHVATGYAVYGLSVDPGSVPAPDVVVAATAWLWVLPVGLMGVYLLLLFPSGELPSRRWRLVAWTAGVAMVVVSVTITFAPGDLADSGFPELVNPLGIPELRSMFAVMSGALLLLPLSVLAAAVSLAVRYRRADASERLQLKWLTTAAVTVALASSIAVVGGLVAGPSAGGRVPRWVVLAQGADLLSIALIPISVGVAILRYRLYDIDVVINRTLVYAALAAFITLVYVGIVVGIGNAIGTRGEPNLALAITATAVVAVVFQPVRARVQRFANRLVYGKRADPYEVLSAFSQRVAGSYALEEVAPRVAQVVAEATGASTAAVWLRIGEELRRVAAHPRQDPHEPHVAVTSISELPDADRSFPIRHREELLGALTVKKQPGDPVRPAEEHLLSSLAEQAGLVLRNVRLTAELEAKVIDVARQASELQASRARVVAAQDAERRRLERNIHDGAQQQLVALAVNVKLARRLAAKDPEKSRVVLSRLKDDVRQAADDLRDLARGIYPPVLTEEGLAAALEAQARKSPIPIEIDADGVGRFAPEAEAAAYFCVLEALQNASKYAGASHATVRLHRQEGEVEFEVEDDGLGFDPDTVKKGSGLQNMADRLAGLGGTLEIRSQPGEGTIITGRVPANEGSG